MAFKSLSLGVEITVPEKANYCLLPHWIPFTLIDYEVSLIFPIEEEQQTIIVQCVLYLPTYSF